MSGAPVNRRQPSKIPDFIKRSPVNGYVSARFIIENQDFKVTECSVYKLFVDN